MTEQDERHQTRSFRWSRLFTGGFVVLVAGAMSQRSMAQCHYTATYIPNYPCPGTGHGAYKGAAINEHGTWVGHRIPCPPNGEFWIPVIGDFNRTPTDLAMPGSGVLGAALGVNDNNVVVGYVWPLVEQATVWTGKEVITLPPAVPDHYSIASDVNNAMQVVGTRETKDGSLGFVWNDGTFINIDPGQLQWCSAFDISNSGVVVGMMGASTTNARGFRWANDSVEMLQPLRGSFTSVALSVNEAGTAVGGCGHILAGTGFVTRAAVWVGVEPQELSQEPGFNSSGATVINNRGVILGLANKPVDVQAPQLRVALMWIDGVRSRIQDLVEGQGYFECYTPLDINDAGQILIEATSNTQTGTFILTPIAPPAADLTGDCAVDGHDVGVLFQHWGGAGPEGDVNADGQIDALDLAELLGAWTVG